MILSQKYSTSISTGNICRQIAVLWLFILRKQCTYCIIVNTLQFAALMLQLTTLTSLTRFFFEIDNLPSRKFCFLTSSRKLVFVISFQFQLNFTLVLFLVFQLTIILFGVKAWYFYYGKCSLPVWL